MIENGQIASVRLKSIVDDEEYVELVEAKLLPAIVAAQSAEIDAVSGATSSSDGVLAAVSEALGKAAGEN